MELFKFILSFKEIDPGQRPDDLRIKFQYLNEVCLAPFEEKLKEKKSAGNNATLLVTNWLKEAVPQLCDDIIQVFHHTTTIRAGFRTEVTSYYSLDKQLWKEYFELQNSQLMKNIRNQIEKLLDVKPTEFRNEMGYLLQLTQENVEVWQPQSSQLQ